MIYYNVALEQINCIGLTNRDYISVYGKYYGTREEAEERKKVLDEYFMTKENSWYRVKIYELRSNDETKNKK